MHPALDKSNEKKLDQTILSTKEKKVVKWAEKVVSITHNQYDNTMVNQQFFNLNKQIKQMVDSKEFI